MKEKRRKDKLTLKRENYLLLLLGVILILLGFYFLWKKFLILAPILLVAGYCIIIPISLLIRFDGKRKETAR